MTPRFVDEIIGTWASLSWLGPKITSLQSPDSPSYVLGIMS